MCAEDKGIDEIEDEAREILEDALKWNARLGGAYGNPEKAETGDDDEDEDDTDTDVPRALTQEEVLLKYAGADVKAMRQDMIEKCRKWRERTEEINKACDEGRMSEFNAINAGSELRRDKSRAYHNWRLGSIGLSKKRIVEGVAEPYDRIIRALGGDPKPSETETDE